MISEKHSAAARRNGAKSRGPVTPEGKAISSRNAMRHGLLARTVLLSNEDPNLFRHYFFLHVERFKPVGDLEMGMIEDMTACGWRMHRAMAIEKQLLEFGIGGAPNRPPIEQITDAWCNPSTEEQLDRLLRHQIRLQNMYMRAFRGLLQLRKLPPADATAPLPVLCQPLPNEPTVPNVSNAIPAKAPSPGPVPVLRALDSDAVLTPGGEIVPFLPPIPD
jgi:hypothetical protein